MGLQARRSPLGVFTRSPLGVRGRQAPLLLYRHAYTPTCALSGGQLVTEFDETTPGGAYFVGETVSIDGKTFTMSNPFTQTYKVDGQAIVLTTNPTPGTLNVPYTTANYLLGSVVPVYVGDAAAYFTWSYTTDVFSNSGCYPQASPAANTYYEKYETYTYAELLAHGSCPYQLFLHVDCNNGTEFDGSPQAVVPDADNTIFANYRAYPFDPVCSACPDPVSMLDCLEANGYHLSYANPGGVGYTSDSPLAINFSNIFIPCGGASSEIPYPPEAPVHPTFTAYVKVREINLP